MPEPGRKLENHDVRTFGYQRRALPDGNKDVPIKNSIELSGGYNTSGSEFAASPSGGLIPVPQKVPGGVIGLTGLSWLLEFFGSEALTLYATTEAAGFPGPPLSDPLSLPIKVHLTNPGGLIGSTCYIGSFAEPIELNLTTGTTEPPPPNEPISGEEGEFGFGEAPGILKETGAVLVDNSFAAPGANGCKLVLFGFIPISINGLVNEFSELPSPAGTNETAQNTDSELVSRSFVYPPKNRHPAVGKHSARGRVQPGLSASPTLSALLRPPPEPPCPYGSTPVSCSSKRSELTTAPASSARLSR